MDIERLTHVTAFYICSPLATQKQSGLTDIVFSGLARLTILVLGLSVSQLWKLSADFGGWMARRPHTESSVRR